MTAMNTKYALKTPSTIRAGSSSSQKRIRALIVALALVVCPSAFAQGTVMPIPLAQWFTNAGAVFDTGGLCVFRAGTSTLASTYTTAALSVANSNPILFNSAGRPTSGGVFLTPGESYKFELRDFTGVVTPTCVAPITGSTIWTVDGIQAVPGSSSGVDVTATAGESITAGDAVYISTGLGGLNAGQIYKMDADLIYKSTGAVMVGLAPNAITSGSSGAMRVSGAVTVAGPLNAGAPYYAAAAAGSITVTPPTNAIRIGVAQTATSIVVGHTEAPVSPRGPPCGRLTLTTGLPVTSSDVTAATTLYYTPAGSCNTISLYDGTAWEEYAFAELSIAVPATTNQMYDVFAYDNAGVVALELTAWTNDSTRATNIVLQNGVYAKTGVLTRRYLGSFRTTAVSGQTEDSFAKRFVWNYYNRVPRAMRVLEATDSWQYTTSTWRQARASTANQVAFVIGVADAPADFDVLAYADNSGGGAHMAVSVGLDSTSAPTTGNKGIRAYVTATGGFVPVFSSLRVFPAVGYHFAAWLEYAITNTNITTWYGDNGDATLQQSGITGVILG